MGQGAKVPRRQRVGHPARLVRALAATIVTTGADPRRQEDTLTTIKSDMTEEQKRALQSRFAIETAIDCELRACACRIIGLNHAVTEDLFLQRSKLAFGSVKKTLEKLKLR
jgi:hypothetical protein